MSTYVIHMYVHWFSIDYLALQKISEIVDIINSMYMKF